MSNVTLSILILIVVVIVIAAALMVGRQLRQKRTEKLKERFGPEYDRNVEQAGSQRTAESRLREREKRHDKLELRDLSEDQRRRYAQRWSDLQRRFVDDPSGAVRGADELVVEVMRVRGYPVGEFEQRAEDLSVSYPVVTQHYRKARRVAEDNREGRADTEELRTAVTSYRELVDALLADRDREDIPRQRTTDPDREPVAGSDQRHVSDPDEQHVSGAQQQHVSDQEQQHVSDTDHREARA